MNRYALVVAVLAALVSPVAYALPPEMVVIVPPKDPNEVPDITDNLHKADYNAGMNRTQLCTSCHTFVKNGASTVGPNLWNIFNNRKASVPGYNYSEALLKTKGQLWTYQELNKFLYAPGVYVYGTKHPSVSLRDNQERANVIAYLSTLNDEVHNKIENK